MSMNTIALGGRAPHRPCCAKKSVFGMPSLASPLPASVRRTVAPATVAMAVESKAGPIMTSFKGIRTTSGPRPSSLTTSSRGISPSPWCATRSFSLGSLLWFSRTFREISARRARARAETYRNTPLALEFDIRSFARLATTRGPGAPAVDGNFAPRGRCHVVKPGSNSALCASWHSHNDFTEKNKLTAPPPPPISQPPEPSRLPSSSSSPLAPAMPSAPSSPPPEYPARLR